MERWVTGKKLSRALKSGYKHVEINGEKITESDNRRRYLLEKIEEKPPTVKKKNEPRTNRKVHKYAKRSKPSR